MLAQNSYRPCVIIIRLDECLRRAHLLAAEDNLAKLEADLGVVNNEGDLSCSIRQIRFLGPSMDDAIPHTLDETDDTTCSSTNLAQSVAQALGITGNGRASSAADARQTVLCLSSSVAGSLAGLLGGGALEAAGGKAHSRGSEHGTGEGLHRGRNCEMRIETRKLAELMSEIRGEMGSGTDGQLMAGELRESQVVGRRLREKKSSEELAGCGWTCWCRKVKTALSSFGAARETRHSHLDERQELQLSFHGNYQAKVQVPD